MKRLQYLVASLVATLFFFGASPLWAAQTQQQGQNSGQQQSSAQSQHNKGQQNQQNASMKSEYTKESAKDLKGEKVFSTSNQNLGSVEDFVVNPQSNKVEYFILSQGGGFFGGGNRVTVPADKVQLKDGKLVANVNMSEFQQIGGTQGKGNSSKPLGNVLGKNVDGKNGKKIGTIDNVLIGGPGGSYAIVSGNNNVKYPIPLQALQSGKNGAFMINYTQQDLKSAPSYSKGFPDFQKMQQPIHSYYSGQQSQQQGQQGQQQQQSNSGSQRQGSTSGSGQHGSQNQ